MVKITVLPPQEEPSKPTAQVKINSLGEHLRAFMNANNISGFIKEDDNELDDDTVAGLLSNVMFGPGLRAGKIRERARKLYRISEGTITNRAANHLVYAALGYHDTNHARKLCGPLDNDTFVPNIGRSNMVQRLYQAPEPTISPEAIVWSETKPSKKMERFLAQYDHKTDPTDSFREVTILDVLRSDGSSVGIRMLSSKELDPHREEHTVSLMDGNRFSVLLDMERMSIDLQGTPGAQDLTVDLGVSLCNLNRRPMDVESTSAAGALIGSRRNLHETEYFNRKMRLSQI